MKKNKSALLLTVLFLTTFNFPKGIQLTASSLDKPTQDIQLSNAGFDEDTLNSLSEFTKSKLSNQLTEDNFQFEIIRSEMFEHTLSYQSVIPNEDIVFILTTSNFEYNNGSPSKIKLCLYYEWLNLPIWRLEDPMIISWDNSLFSFFCLLSHEDHYLLNGIDHTYMSNSTCESNTNTVIWNACLKTGNFLGIGGTIQGLYGFGEVILNLNSSTSSIIALFHTKYVHSKFASVSYSLGTYSGYSISSTSSFDYVDKDVIFNY